MVILIPIIWALTTLYALGSIALFGEYPYPYPLDDGTVLPFLAFIMHLVYHILGCVFLITSFAILIGSDV